MGDRTTKMLDCAKGLREELTKYYENTDSSVDLLERHKQNPTEILKTLGLRQNLYQTALNISPEAHLKMQSAWQENTSNAVSKTINAPNDITAEEISAIYMQAWELGWKGVTVYRSGTRELEVLAPS